MIINGVLIELDGDLVRLTDSNGQYVTIHRDYAKDFAQAFDEEILKRLEE